MKDLRLHHYSLGYDRVKFSNLCIGPI